MIPYAKSPNPSIAFDAKIVSLLIASYLRKSDYKHLLLSSDQMQQITLSLKKAVKGNTSLNLYGATCSMAEVLVWLEKAALIEENVDLMINHGMLEFFPALMQVRDQDTATKGAKLMWTIACTVHKVRETLCQRSDIIALLKTSPSLKISQYVLCCIQLVDTGKKLQGKRVC